MACKMHPDSGAFMITWIKQDFILRYIFPVRIAISKLLFIFDVAPIIYVGSYLQTICRLTHFDSGLTTYSEQDGLCLMVQSCANQICSLKFPKLLYIFIICRVWRKKSCLTYSQYQVMCNNIKLWVNLWALLQSYVVNIFRKN